MNKKVLPRSSLERQKSVDWDSSSGAPAGGAVDTDSSLSHEQPAENTTYRTHSTHELYTSDTQRHTNTHHVCGSVAPGDVMHSGRRQVMLVRLRNLLQRILMRNTCIHTQIPTNTQSLYLNIYIYTHIHQHEHIFFCYRTHQSVPSARYLGCCGIGCGT